MAQQRKMILGAVARGIGSHVAAWRLPSVSPGKLKAATTLQHWADTARAAEAGKMHFVFLADLLAMPNAGHPALLSRSAFDFSLEPMTLLSALAPLTEKIGLVGSISTTYSEPYNVARLLASLDHLSGGRAGWNVVTSLDPASARNFGTGSFWRSSTATSAPRSSPGWSRACGIAGKTTHSSTTSATGSFSIPRRCIPCGTGRNISRWKGRST